MFHLEELTIQYLNHKITVVNVKKPEGPVGRTTGLGLLYMGYQSLFRGSPRVQQRALIGAVGQEEDTNCTHGDLEPLLDTGPLKLFQSSIASCSTEVQTDLSVPIWMFSSNVRGMFYPQLDGDCAAAENNQKDETNIKYENKGSIAKRWSGSLVPVNLNSESEFTFVHFEKLNQPGKGISMLQTGKPKNIAPSHSTGDVWEIDSAFDSSSIGEENNIELSVSNSSAGNMTSTVYPFDRDLNGPIVNPAKTNFLFQNVQSDLDSDTMPLDEHYVRAHSALQTDVPITLSVTNEQVQLCPSASSSMASAPVIPKILGLADDSSPDEMTPLIVDRSEPLEDKTSIFTSEAHSATPSISYKAYKIDTMSSSVALSKARMAVYVPESCEQPSITSALQYEGAKRMLLGGDYHHTNQISQSTSLPQKSPYRMSSRTDVPQNGNVSSSRGSDLDDTDTSVIENVPQYRTVKQVYFDSSENTKDILLQPVRNMRDDYRKPCNEMTVDLEENLLGKSASCTTSPLPSPAKAYRAPYSPGGHRSPSRIVTREAFESGGRHAGMSAAQLGLNQFVSVISKYDGKHETSGLGLNQLQATNKSKQRFLPNCKVAALSPGGDGAGHYPRTSSQASSRGSLLSGSTSPGSFVFATYDDGSEWQDDSLLWEDESLEVHSAMNLSMEDVMELTMEESFPDWMGQLPTQLTTIPLTSLVIPGSHISLAIQNDLNMDMEIAPCNYEMAAFLQTLPNLGVFNNFRVLVKQIWKAWMPKQVFGVIQQLQAGIRYLDVRVTRYQNSIYAEHGLYAKPLVHYVRQIKMFLDAHIQEVVIIHFDSFGHVDVKDKRRLVTMLFQIFGARMAKTSDPGQMTLSQLWKKKKQVIVVFPADDVEALKNHMFAGLIWSDSHFICQPSPASSPKELLPYLESTYYMHILPIKSESFHILRAALTPDMCLIFGDYEYESMLDLTEKEIHPVLLQWLTDKTKLNIVAFDFVGMAGLVGKLLKLNHCKAVTDDSINGH